jgi:hypothetical protein
MALRLTPVGAMVGGSVVAWVMAATVLGPALLPEVLFGMLAPLLVAVVSWALAERTYRRDPARLTGLMVTAFAGKMVFFGAYVAVMLQGLKLQPVPFVVSFTGSFIGLHVAEALCLRRLFQGDASASNHVNS